MCLLEGKVALVTGANRCGDPVRHAYRPLPASRPRASAAAPTILGAGLYEPVTQGALAQDLLGCQVPGGRVNAGPGPGCGPTM
jgi:hypothetical protein